MEELRQGKREGGREGLYGLCCVCVRVCVCVADFLLHLRWLFRNFAVWGSNPHFSMASS